MQKRIGRMRLQQPHLSGEAGGDARRRAKPCRRDSLRRTHPGFQDRLPSAVSRRSGKGWRHGLIIAVSHPFCLAAPDLFRAHGLRAVGITWPRREDAVTEASGILWLTGRQWRFMDDGIHSRNAIEGAGFEFGGSSHAPILRLVAPSELIAIVTQRKHIEIDACRH